MVDVSPKEEPKVWKVRHGTFKGNYRESTYSETGIQVIAGVAHCRTQLAAQTLVKTKGYDWLDERDDPTAERYKRNARKAKSLREKVGDAAKSVVDKVKGSTRKNKESKKTPEE